MKRAGLLLIGTLLLSASAHADEFEARPSDEFGARERSLTIGFQGAGDGMGEFGDFTGGPIVEFWPLLPRSAPALRPSVYGAVVYGTWGDVEHGRGTIDFGAKVRADLLAASHLLTPYLVGKAGFDVEFCNCSNNIAPAREAAKAGEVGLGLGVRGFGMVSLEATLDAVVALDDGSRFHTIVGHTPTTSTALARVSVGASFDLCALSPLSGICDYPDRRAVDVTCRLLTDAERAANQPGWNAEARGRLCAAVDRALDTPRKMPDESSTDGFLAALVAELAGKPELAVAQKIAAEHARLSACQTRGRDAERSAYRARKVVLTHVVYEPVPLELRDAFGCAPGKPGQDRLAACQAGADPPADVCPN